MSKESSLLKNKPTKTTTKQNKKSTQKTTKATNQQMKQQKRQTKKPKPKSKHTNTISLVPHYSNAEQFPDSARITCSQYMYGCGHPGLDLKTIYLQE